MSSKLAPTKTTGVNNPLKDVAPDLSVGHYGYEIVEQPKELIDSAGYPSYRLHFVVAGAVTLYYSGKKTVLKKNSVFVLMPNTGISYQAHYGKTHTVLCWVTFSGYKALHYCKKMGLTEEEPFILLEDSKITHYVYDNFAKKENFSSSMLSLTMQKNLLCIIEYLYARRTSKEADAESWQNTSKSAQTYMQKMLRYIDRHLSDPNLSIKLFSEKLTVHPSTLSRLFKKEMSVCFTEYVTLKRCELAVTYLEKGTFKVNEVAHMVGFEDPLYFSRIYKKIFKCAPSDTIRRAQKASREKNRVEMPK